MKILKVFACVCMCFCFIFCTACGKSEEPKDPNLKSSDTKEYYIRNGYVDVDVSKDFNVSGDIIYFDDGTVYAKIRKTLALTFVGEGFVQASQTFVNFATKKILTSIKLNDETIKISDFDLQDIYVDGSLSIYPVYSNFDIAGVLVQLNLNYGGTDNQVEDTAFQTDDSLFARDDILYVKCDSGSISEATASSLSSNSKFSFCNDDSLRFTFELDQNYVLNVFLLLKCNNEYYTMKICYDNSSNTYKFTNFEDQNEFDISVAFADDLSTSPLIEN